ncbi:MAG: hypothetical protein JJ899_04245 [Alphaproteobacteria bacterium]|nr:hypothetical protein [Alphaproteobacteria bacterium]
MSLHRYHRRDVSADFLRAGLGFAACVAPMFFLAPGAPATYVLAMPAAFFALFAVRTWNNARTAIELDETGITARGGTSGRIDWQDLRRLKLSYFSTRRDREAGWMQLKLTGNSGSITLHSTLEGFEDVCRVAHRAAVDANIELSDASARNFQVLGLGAPLPPANTVPAALSGWGNPADWRR